MPETKMDEKQAQPQPAPGAPSATKGNNFLLIARIWVAVMGLAQQTPAWWESAESFPQRTAPGP